MRPSRLSVALTLFLALGLLARAESEPNWHVIEGLAVVPPSSATGDVQSDGRLVTSTGFDAAIPATELRRYSATGEPDPTFVTRRFWSIARVIVAPDDDVLVQADELETLAKRVVRLQPNGELRHVLPLAETRLVAVDSLGRVYTSSEEGEVRRYLTDGSLDSGYSASRRDTYYRTIDGKLLQVSRDNEASALTVRRLASDGSIDPSFVPATYRWPSFDPVSLSPLPNGDYVVMSRGPLWNGQGTVQVSHYRPDATLVRAYSVLEDSREIAGLLHHLLGEVGGQVVDATLPLQVLLGGRLRVAADGTGWAWRGAIPGVYRLQKTNPAQPSVALHPRITLGQGPIQVADLGAPLFTSNVVALGEQPLAYQWYYQGTAIATTAARLTLRDVKLSDAGTYTVHVSNSHGEAGAELNLYVNPQPRLPLILLPPTPRSAAVGTEVWFDALVHFPQGDAWGNSGYQWFHNGVEIPGATESSLHFSAVSTSHAGNYSVRASNLEGQVTSASATLSVTGGETSSITFLGQSPGGTHPAGSTVAVSGSFVSAGSLSWQWYKDGVLVPGATSPTLFLINATSRDNGSYVLVARNGADSASTSPIVITISGGPAAAYLGTIGSLGTSGSWALLVMGDDTGRFLAVLPERNQAIVAEVTIGADGRFTFGQPGNAAADGLTSTAARYYTGPGQGTISGNTVTGTLTALNLSFSGHVTASGDTADSVGYYHAVPTYTAAGAVYAIATRDGRSFGVVVDSGVVFGGVGTLTNGKMEVRTGSGLVPALIATLDPARSTLSGELQFSGRPNVTVAPAALPSGAERLINLSTRARAGSGSDTLIAGFVIGGSERKSVLVRAAGPALIPHQVVGAMVDPVLNLYQGDTKIFENDNWEVPAKATIEEAIARVGAFPFAAGSKDAALMRELAPGAYSAHVTSNGGTTSGVALIEVYEYSGSASAPRLLNLSARSPVGRGDDILIVGLVVTGDAPKRYLIRGVGPTLTDFKVTGVLQNPRLQLFRGKELVRENDDWSSGGDAGDIAAAAAATGAFALSAGSKDAALLVYLPPGAYTAHISGVDDTTGVALIEAYEVP